MGAPEARADVSDTVGAQFAVGVAAFEMMTSAKMLDYAEQETAVTKAAESGRKHCIDVARDQEKPISGGTKAANRLQESTA